MTGIIATLALFVGAITSNTFAIKKLRSDWKPIQMIAAYTAFAFAAFHTGNTFALILFIVLKFLEAKETKTGPFFRAHKKIKTMIK